MSTTAALLTTARRQAGLSQRQLAAAADIPQASVSRIERGLISPRASTTERWLAACDMTLEIRPASDTGIDVTMIRARLAMTPIERSRLGVQEANAMLRLERGQLRRTQP
jgi:transcriptional regulator with XRE-family HTH domain